MPPLSFINDEGKADGILVDMWKEWAKHSEIPIRFDLKDWKEAVSETVSGKYAVNAGLFYSDKRARSLVFGDYLFHMRGSMFAEKSLIRDGNVNLEETICGVLKNGYSKTFMEKNYPFTPLMLFNSVEEMFRTISEGRMKLLVADYPVAQYLIHQHGLEKSFSLVKHMYTRDLLPAVSKRNKELISTVNLYMAAIPKKKKNAIINKWLSRKREVNIAREATVWLAILIVLGITLFHRKELKAFLTVFKKGK